jgi:hypothetical protein
MRLSIPKFVASAVLAACVAGTMSAFAHGGMEMGNNKSVTVKGEILDLACYLDHGARGMKHQQCALTCLKNGEPMGLITAEGKVYLLLADHQNGKPFEEAKALAADQVEVSGPMVTRDGIAGLTVLSVKKL